MDRHLAEVVWHRGRQDFIDGRYSRKHLLRFDGGIEIIGSASPSVVPQPYSAADAVDPEELFIAALSGCHMLWFLSLAAGRGIVVDRYRDLAEGVMARNERGQLMLATVTLRPEIDCPAEIRLSEPEFAEIHHLAHEACFIANSVRTTVTCLPKLNFRSADDGRAT